MLYALIIWLELSCIISISSTLSRNTSKNKGLAYIEGVRAGATVGVYVIRIYTSTHTGFLHPGKP